MHCWQAYVCTLVIYNQSPISPLNVSTCSYSLAHYGHPQCEYKPPPLHQRSSSIFTQRLFQVQCSISCMCFCWDNLHVYVCLRVFPRAFAAYPQFNSIYDLSLLPLAWNPATLLAPVLPPPSEQHQQRARWHSRWQWPQERRVHPQQQSTRAPYRHRPLDDAICRGHLWVDNIIGSQPIKTP